MDLLIDLIDLTKHCRMFEFRVDQHLADMLFKNPSEKTLIRGRRYIVVRSGSKCDHLNISRMSDTYVMPKTINKLTSSAIKDANVMRLPFIVL